MAIIRKAAAVCDRCGAVQEFDCGIDRPLSAVPAKPGSPLAGWAQLRDGTCLCADCEPLYSEMLERHRREVREFLGVRAVEFEVAP